MIVSEKMAIGGILSIATATALFFGFPPSKEQCYECDVKKIESFTNKYKAENDSLRSEIKDTLIVGKKAIKELPIIQEKLDSTIEVVEDVRCELKISNLSLKKKPKEVIKHDTIFKRDTVKIIEKKGILGFGNKKDTIK